MNVFHCVWILMVLCLLGCIRNSLANSIFGIDLFDLSNEQPSPEAHSDENDARKNEDITQISVPFEDLAIEDKFLFEAEKINSILPSSLDRCEHKVIMKMKSSCSDMTEEELAKLSIRLLNCQSEISGRNQVTCSDSMTLKECISPMDSELWNAYHTINNRARTVCYAMRQQQFRALSEMAVNKLMSSAQQQLTNMDEFKELQRELNVLTAETVSTLSKGQRELLDQTGDLRAAQDRARLTMASNIKHLALEQSLIQSTHDQLTKLADKFTQQFETQESKFGSLKEQQHDAFDNVLSRLSHINTLWSAIEKKSEHLLQQQERIEKSNSETLENLKQINKSVLFLTDLVTRIKTEVEVKLEWAKDFAGGDGALLILVAQNALYLLAAVLVTLFLQLSLRYRLTLLVAVTTNTLLVYRQQSLGFLDLTLWIAGWWAVISLVPICWRFAVTKFKSSSSTSLSTSQKKNQVEVAADDNVSSTISFSRLQNRSETNENQREYLAFNEHKDVDIDRISNHSFSSSLRSRRSTSQSESGRVCSAVCRNGQSCRSTPTPGRQFCRRHLPR